MKNIKLLFKINFATYFIIISCFFTGYIKYAILIFLIILVHELGHIFFIKLKKYQITKIEIFPFGGITTLNKPINTPVNEEILISLGGIIAQIFLFGLFKVILNLGFLNINTYLIFKKYNLIILIFNLLPIIPLDGYKILNLILEKSFSFQKSYLISGFISILFLGGFLSYNYFYSLNNYLILGFMLYKIIRYYQDYKYVLNRFFLERYLKDFSYHKIKNHQQINLNFLKKETYHFFKSKNKYISEKSLLAKKFDSS